LSFTSSRTAVVAGATLGITATTLLLLGGGCGKQQDTFARVNGQAISQDEYVRALERTVIQGAGVPTPVPAGRLVLDQMIGNKVVMAEASRLGVMPDDKAVDQRFDLQKRIMQEQMPQSTYEEEIKKQGLTAKDVKDQFRSQLAETELLAKRLNVKEEDVKKAYETQKTNLGMPERVQLRVIAVPAQGDDAKQVQQALASKTDFAEVAKTYNSSPQLKTSGGLLPQATPINQVPAPWRSKVNTTKPGAFFGPVDAPATPGAPPLKAWVKVENKLPTFQLTYEDAKPLIRQMVVQQMMQDPKNQGLRQEIMALKLKAKFEPTDERYNAVWGALKEAASAAGLGQTGGGGAMAPTPVIPTPMPPPAR